MFDFLKRRETDPRKVLKELLGKYDLPSLPSSTINLLGLLRDPEIPMAEVASRVEMDPGLTVRILRLINSAGFGLLNQVSNLQHAVGLLGRSRLESLVLTFAAADRIPARMECMGASQFWSTAARRATLARALAQHLHAATQAEAFTAGLLQDIAVPVLAASNPKGYTDLLSTWQEEGGQGLDELERELFGFDHASVGALMAQDWGLPEYLVEAIGSHHQRSGARSPDPAVGLVSLLKYSQEDDGTETVVSVAEEEFGIESQLMDEMITRSYAAAEEFSDMFPH